MAVNSPAHNALWFLPRKKKEKNTQSMLNFLAYYLFFLCVVVIGILCYIWQPLQVVKIGYQIHRLSELRNKLKTENNLLKLEYSSLKYNERIQSIAERKLNMIMPREGQVVYIDRDVLH